MKLRLLPLLVAAVVAAQSAAAAATPAAAPTPASEAARKAELAKARAELAENARRVAELSRDEHGDRAHGRYEYAFGGPPRIGIGIVMGESGTGGVRIAAVTPDGPAAKAGLRAGDVLTSVDGKAVTGDGEDAIRAARRLLADLEKGDTLRLGYTRAGKAAQASVTAAPIDRVMRFGVDFPRGELLPPGAPAPLVSPGVEMEIARLAACADGQEGCELPVLGAAFRWNGVNLAAVDAKLGRYFGTDRGVLVLSGGEALAALEPGDVIQKIDGVAVATPRDAMRALRDEEAGDRVDVIVLRDRKARTVAVTVPEAPSLRWFAPPPPPAPPAPPTPPTPPTPRAYPAPAPAAVPAAPAAPGTPAPPAPPAAPPPPPDSAVWLEAPEAPAADAFFIGDDGELVHVVSRQRTVGDDGVERIVVRTVERTAD